MPDKSNPSSRHLFTSGVLGRHLLRSRMVMAPMTRNRVAANGVPAAVTVRYYTQRATAALLITEATAVSPQAVGYQTLRVFTRGSRSRVGNESSIRFIVSAG